MDRQGLKIGVDEGIVRLVAIPSEILPGKLWGPFQAVNHVGDGAHPSFNS